MPNKNNLIPGAHKLTVEEQSRGGKASVKSRRKKKLLKEIICEELDKNIEIDGITVTKEEAAVMRLVNILIDEEVDARTFLKALELTRDTIGEKPIDPKELKLIKLKEREVKLKEDRADENW